MPGYAKTPLWKKLGIRAGDVLALVDPPPGWSVPDIPAGVQILRESRDRLSPTPVAMVIGFFGALSDLDESLPMLAPRIFPAGALWVAWPRRAAGHESDIRDNDVRSASLPLGLVDVKVAALDEDWSGLRLVWRADRRETSGATPR
jgi:hypothetical protein